jgi:dTDP-4-dehydrorhamnose reductase
MPLVHVSTDYVFDGRNHRPYVEEDPTDPQGVYGRTKLAGEEALRRIAPERSVIVRTSWVYSSYGANFVKTMLRLGRERDELGVIFDQVGTPTYARNLAKAILEILPRLENKQPEIYHYSDEGVCSWYDFALAIFEETGVDCRVRPIRTQEYPTPAARPHYSLLDKSRIKEHYGLKIPHWRVSLRECLGKIGDDFWGQDFGDRE